MLNSNKTKQHLMHIIDILIMTVYMLIVMGIIFQLGTQALLNIGVACNAFPNTGISLPFFSSGGTALLIQLAEMGVVLAVSRQSEV